jgi:hypothetical protein
MSRVSTIPAIACRGGAGEVKTMRRLVRGPALDGDRQNEPAQQIAEVIGDDPEE